MSHINEQQLSGQILASNKNEMRRKILEQEQEEIDQIDRLVTKIHKIALDTGNMILQQGMKLQIAAITMTRVKNNLQDGRQ
jgi:vacuolar-type H+-ATPase subunit E/Vma4